MQSIALPFGRVSGIWSASALTARICLCCLLITCGAWNFPDEYEKVTLIHVEGKPMVSARINGKKAYFLLDTGSALSILHSRDAGVFDFKVRPVREYRAPRVSSFGGSIQSLHHVSDVHIEIGETPIHTYFYAYNMEHLVKSLAEKTRYKISGIIGTEVMNRYGFQLDFVNKSVQIQGMQRPKSSEFSITQPEG